MCQRTTVKKEKQNRGKMKKYEKEIKQETTKTNEHRKKINTENSTDQNHMLAEHSASSCMHALHEHFFGASNTPARREQYPCSRYKVKPS